MAQAYVMGIRDPPAPHGDYLSGPVPFIPDTFLTIVLSKNNILLIVKMYQKRYNKNLFNFKLIFKQTKTSYIV